MYRLFTCVSVVCLLLCVPAAQGTDYAVIISAGRATTDDAPCNSCFWYNAYLQYMTLLDEGYADDDIYLLYGLGTDFASSHECYQPPYPLTDYAVSRANIQSVFTTLAGIMGPDDFLYVWWMGHGGFIGGYYAMSIMTTGEYVYGYEMETWVGQIEDYDVRTFSWMTCHSGGILDYLEGLRSIVMSSATADESTYDQWLCDTWHAEFHYPERCAWAWETPCGICGPVDADTDASGRVSFAEAFVYAEDNTAMSHPQMRDLGGLAPTTYLSTETGGGVVYEYKDDFSTHKAEKDSYDHSIFWPEMAFPPAEPYLFYTRVTPPPGGLGFADYDGKMAHLAYGFPILTPGSIEPRDVNGTMELDVFFYGHVRGRLYYSVSPDGKLWSFPIRLGGGHQKFDLACSQGAGWNCYVRLLGHDVVIDDLYVVLTDKE